MAKAFAYLVVGLRFLVILGWAGAVVAAVLFLPPLPSAGGGLTDLIPAGSAAAHADADATRLFGYPLEAGVAIVQRDSGGLPPAVELFTVLAIALIVGVRFRSVLAPVTALTCAGAAYVLATRIVAWGAQRTGITVPQDADPVLVVLLLGVTTDYCVFFLAGMRSRLAEGAGCLQAVRDSTARSAPIVLAAGLIVAAGTGALVVARGGLLRAFGPGLAATVLVSMVVSLTLMPALLGVFGGVMFRGALGGESPAAGLRLARLAASRPVALLVAAGCVAGLVLAATGARGLGLGSPLIGEMPPSSDVARAGAAAAAGFAPGILTPAEVLVISPGAGSQAAAANRLEAALRRQPGVASVVGPAVLPASTPSPNPMVAKDGQAIRFALVYDTDPLNATAIGQVRVLAARLPALGRAAGLRGVRYETGGQSALTSDAITSTASDLWRVGLAIMLVTLLLLMVFLRAALAPVYLLAASVLAVLATLGLTVVICDAVLGSPDLVYFVPFAAGVLLVALGSDYNVFVAGRIWAEARARPARDAVAVAAPRASGAITTAGVALAASFGLLAVIPLAQFRQLAIMMAVGVMLDSVIVRSFLVPALVALTGRFGMWPGHQRIREDGRRPASMSGASR